MKISTEQLIELHGSLSLLNLLKRCQSADTRNALLETLDTTRSEQLEAELKALLDQLCQSDRRIYPAYEYRGALIEGSYSTPKGSEMCFAATVSHPQVREPKTFRAYSWEQAQQLAETAVDELLASWV